MHGTLPLMEGLLRRAGTMSLPLAAVRKRIRRTVASTSHESGVRSPPRQRPGGQNSHGKRPRQQRTDPGSCPGARHSATECREIQKLAERLSKRRDQASREGSSPPRRSGKEKASDADAAAMERELGYQTTNKDLKGLFHQSDSESGGDERCKKLYVMYGGSSKLVSWGDVKALRREVLSVKPGTRKAAPHQRWKSTTITFGPSDCPENMAGAEVLPFVTAPTIANVRLHHVLIDGGAGLSVISYAAFKHLQIPESKLAPSHPFSGVGPNPVYPVGTISLPVTFGTEVNFRTENVQFEVAEANLPFNAIIGRPVHCRCPLRVLGPEVAVPGRRPHRAERPDRCRGGG
jgi:hypothetical protein